MVAWVLRLILLLVLSAVPAYALRLPTIVTPIHYDLAFVVDLAGARFDGTETIRVNVSEPTSHIVLHAKDLRFAEVNVGRAEAAQRAAVTQDEANETATLTVPKQLPKGETVILIRYSGILNDKLRGFYLSHGANRTYAVTQFETTDARRAFPCFDEPSFKATFAITLTIDRDDMAISNGRVIADTPGPSAGQHTVKFSTSPKMSSYLVAMAVGDFQCTAGSADRVLIRVCATPEKKHLTTIALESAEYILTFYNRYYAIKYPFEKLDVLGVPDFAAGAMENTGAIFYRETDLLAAPATASVGTRKNIGSVLAHEMAHQWFGDLVTMRWWDDIWLNEGFATWMANRPLEEWKPDWNVPVDEELEKQQALGLDSLKSTRPIHTAVESPAEIDAVFDLIAYEKGGAVLRMIEGYLGRETFRRGVNAYLQAHAYGNAKSEDFWAAMAAASGKPIDRILPTFVNQPGAPLVDVSLTCENGRTTVALAQRRFFVDAAELEQAPPSQWQIPLCLKTRGASNVTCDVLTDATRSLSIPGACSPWVFANAGAHGYYRTAYPAAMLRAMAPDVETSLSAAERLSLLDDEWALVRAGRHSVADYLTIAAGYGRERASGVLGELVNRLAFVHEYLSSGGAAQRFEGFTRSLFAPLAAEIGLSNAPADPDDRRQLRAVLLGALGTIANDQDAIRLAQSALDRTLAGSAPLDPTLADPIVTIAAQNGDAPLYDKLITASDRASSPEERYRYLYAGARFRDPAVLDRALQRVLTPDIRNQDASLYLSRFFANPVARPIAWQFLKDHWSEIEPKVTIFGGDAGLMSALGSFCDPRSRDDIKAFLAAHPTRSGSRSLDRSLERIDNCIALREKQTPLVTDWLKAS